MSLTHHRNQMKLFAAITSTAVIGTSFLVPNPVEARNGWVLIATSRSGNTAYYVKPIDSSGRYRRFVARSSDDRRNIQMVADCSKWRVRGENNSKWNDTMPGSVGDKGQNIICR